MRGLNVRRAHSPKVRNKAYLVEDALCEDDCPQLWEGECRAYLLPHSEEERKHRLRGEFAMNCMRMRLDLAPEGR